MRAMQHSTLQCALVWLSDSHACAHLGYVHTRTHGTQQAKCTPIKRMTKWLVMPKSVVLQPARPAAAACKGTRTWTHIFRGQAPNAVGCRRKDIRQGAGAVAGAEKQKVGGTQ